MTMDARGVLYPARLPEFHRLPPAPDLVQAVRWFWIPEWRLPAGVESRQQILPFPACQLVVESGPAPDAPSRVLFVGPPTHHSERTLVGRGWAVGAYLLPAAAPRFAELVPTPEAAGLAGLRETQAVLDEPEFARSVAAAMEHRSGGDESGDARRARAVDVFSAWIRGRLAPLTESGELANRLGELIASPGITRVDQLPARLHVSPRTLQRIAYHHFGLSPHSMIRRRRLQEGAARLREEPGLTVAALASELGYADHAHFTTDFKTVVGVTPSDYRAEAHG